MDPLLYVLIGYFLGFVSGAVLAFVAWNARAERKMILIINDELQKRGLSKKRR
jgi:hypothetical protein